MPSSSTNYRYVWVEGHKVNIREHNGSVLVDGEDVITALTSIAYLSKDEVANERKILKASPWKALVESDGRMWLPPSYFLKIIRFYGCQGEFDPMLNISPSPSASNSPPRKPQADSSPSASPSSFRVSRIVSSPTTQPKPARHNSPILLASSSDEDEESFFDRQSPSKNKAKGVAEGRQPAQVQARRKMLFPWYSNAGATGGDAAVGKGGSQDSVGSSTTSSGTPLADEEVSKEKGKARDFGFTGAGTSGKVNSPPKTNRTVAPVVAKTPSNLKEPSFNICVPSGSPRSGGSGSEQPPAKPSSILESLRGRFFVMPKVSKSAAATNLKESTTVTRNNNGTTFKVSVSTESVDGAGGQQKEDKVVDGSLSPSPRFTVSISSSCPPTPVSPTSKETDENKNKNVGLNADLEKDVVSESSLSSSATELDSVPPSPETRETRDSDIDTTAARHEQPETSQPKPLSRSSPDIIITDTTIKEPQTARRSLLGKLPRRLDVTNKYHDEDEDEDEDEDMDLEIKDENLSLPLPTRRSLKRKLDEVTARLERVEAALEKQREATVAATAAVAVDADGIILEDAEGPSKRQKIGTGSGGGALWGNVVSAFVGAVAGVGAFVSWALYEGAENNM
ncbi:hypothetical protein HK102_007275 [Quaeritorhiza haematococci]|nr:hypothetical protein HK102_007275 [Quaeritorhiza haematococci]